MSMPETFSPLFIGAMVATATHVFIALTMVDLRPSLPLSPLFIGAMVATNIGALDDMRSENFYFQSAFHRGNGCYYISVSNDIRTNMNFQSPFHRGNGCYSGDTDTSCHLIDLSVPFSSGQWLLRNLFSFFIGAMVAFSPAFRRGNGCYSRTGQWLLLYYSQHWHPFSPLFIGAMVATSAIPAGLALADIFFQSAFHRGNGCYRPRDQ